MLEKLERLFKLIEDEGEWGELYGENLWEAKEIVVGLIQAVKAGEIVSIDEFNVILAQKLRMQIGEAIK